MCRSNFVVRSLIGASLVWTAVAIPPAEAVVVYNASEINRVAPADDPGWNNVAYLGNGSAVYLGNRWMITANHLSGSSVRLSDGRTFAVSIGTENTLSNPADSGIFGSPDLRMFQIAEDPGLPSLNIATLTPGRSNTVMMIGAGHAQLSGLTGWNINANSVWFEAPLSVAREQGYSIIGNSAHQMQWGVNLVSASSLIAPDDTTISFSTTFTRPGVPFDAQAVVGDSGGGVFQKVDGKWVLTGIMDSIQKLPGQPDATVVYGDQTYSADLASYRDQIVSMVSKANSQWRNPLNVYDVDHSGGVSSIDALILINALTPPFGPHALTGAPSATDGFLDVDGDYALSSTDALRVINALIAGIGNPTASSQSNANLVPEPSSAVLALVGLLGLAAAHQFKRRRAKHS